jgi:hypothetical protein
MLSPMNAAAIIAELKALPPEDFAEVSAYMLTVERDDPALQVALHRKRESVAKQVEGRSYAQARTAAMGKLRDAK